MNMRLLPFIILLLSGCNEPANKAATETVESADASRAAVAPVASEAKERPAGEQLLAAPPQGWKQVFSSNNPGLQLVEFIPQAQDNVSWSEKITFESLVGKPVPDPIEFLNALSIDQRATCDGFESYSTFSGYENGYPTSIQLLICDRSRIIDQSQVTMIKAIAGDNNFYTITRAQRGPALAEGAQALTETEVAGWSLYLRAISVCDTNQPEEHACPADS